MSNTEILLSRVDLIGMDIHATLVNFEEQILQQADRKKCSELVGLIIIKLQYWKDYLDQNRIETTDIETLHKAQQFAALFQDKELFKIKGIK